MRPRIVIGTRGSELALAQTNMMADALRALAPDCEVAVEIIHSQGDKVQNIPLAQMGGKGLFTKELEDALLDGRIDLAVHSLKDLPTELPAGLCVAAIPEREDPRDVLVTRDGKPLDELPQGARVGTSSLRRRAQLLSLRPDLQMPDIRGNVPTRLGKVKDGHYDATLLALAGLRRLGLEANATEILGPDTMLPAPGQGALGIECREDDAELRALLGRLTHAGTTSAVNAERALLSAMGGGCHTPLGAWGVVEGDALKLHGCVASEDGAQVWRVVVSGRADAPEALGQEAARQLKAQGAFVEGAAVDTEALAGLRIVVTRPRAQSSRLVEELESRGAKVLVFPTIAISPVEPPPAIAGAGNFDWVVYTSANAVSMMAYVLNDAERSLDSYRACKICTVGPATAARCRDYGLTVSLTPDRFVADAIADAMEQVEGSLDGKRLLLPRGNLARAELLETLKAKGAKVTEVVVYRTLEAKPTPEERAALKSFDADWVLFSSASTAENLVNILGAEEMAALSKRVRFAAIGPTTRAMAEDLGLTVALEPERQDVTGLVVALVAAARG